MFYITNSSPIWVPPAIARRYTLRAKRILAQSYPGCQIGQASSDIEAIERLQVLLLTWIFGKVPLFTKVRARNSEDQVGDTHFVNFWV